jgi:hypothetical protein
MSALLSTVLVNHYADENNRAAYPKANEQTEQGTDDHDRYPDDFLDVKLLGHGIL